MLKLTPTERSPWSGGLPLRAHVWLVATLMPLLVRVMPLKWLLRLLTPSARIAPYRGVDCSAVHAAVERRLSRPMHMRRRACLRRGLLLYHFLRLAGQPAIVHFAVHPPSTDPKRLHAHCWVTVRGRALCEPAPPGTAEMLAYGGGMGVECATQNN